MASPSVVTHPNERVLLERLNRLIAEVSASNAFQRDRLDGVVLHSIDDLRQIRPIGKADLLRDQQAHPPFGRNLTYPRECYVHLHQTSGSSGSTLRILDTQEDWAWWRTCLRDVFTAAGVGPSDLVALAYSFGPYIQFWASFEGAGAAGASRIALGGMDSVQRLETIREYGATTLACTPSYAVRLARVAYQKGLGDALSSVTKIICTGEPGASLPAVRSQIETLWEARCLDHAGLSEVGAFGYPCAEGGGVHINEREFVAEIVAPGSDEPVGPGEVGELIVTAIGRTGFPAIRYRTGDVVECREDSCPAGHAGRWLPGGILGRTDDMVVIRGMNVFPSAIEQVLREFDELGEFRITFYTEPAAMDEVKVEVELATPNQGRAIQARLRTRLGLRVRIVPLQPGILTAPRDKAHRVIDLRETSRRRSSRDGTAMSRSVGGAEAPASPSTSHTVAERIRRFIADEGRQPGDRLGREEDLAHEFGVSRPTLREALRLLSSEHLVRASKGPGGGIFVAATPEQGIGLSVSAAVVTMLNAQSIGLDELLETRMLVEIPLAGLAAARATEHDLVGLRALVDDVNAAATDHARTLEADARLHHLIAKIADNRLAGALTGWIADVLQPRLAAVIEPAVVVSVIADQHRDLLEAIARGDPAAAERAMREHLVYLRDVTTAIEQSAATEVVVQDDERPA